MLEHCKRHVPGAPLDFVVGRGTISRPRHELGFSRRHERLECRQGSLGRGHVALNLGLHSRELAELGLQPSLLRLNYYRDHR